MKRYPPLSPSAKKDRLLRTLAFGDKNWRSVPRHCCICGEPFEPVRKTHVYCNAECKAAYTRAIGELRYDLKCGHITQEAFEQAVATLTAHKATMATNGEVVEEEKCEVLERRRREVSTDE